jgi:pimeloyl-ACP methyl ester carboxylesterase
MTKTFEYIKSNGVTLHVLKAGPETGRLVILLHGFPEFWYGWRNQIEFFANAGYYIWVPDQRGYNLSEKPVGVAAYNLDNLAADVVGLIDAAGRDKAIVIGHDWGAAVAWRVANQYPQRVERLVILNVPHPVVMGRALKRNRRQQLRSWYIFFLLIPWLPERVARLWNWKLLTHMLVSSSRLGTFTNIDLDHYREAWSQPHAFRSMSNWYRAMMQTAPVRLVSQRITVPTLMLWGVKDIALGIELAQPSIDLCNDGRIEFFHQASHWVHHEESERVNNFIVEFMKAASAGGE